MILRLRYLKAHDKFRFVIVMGDVAGILDLYSQLANCPDILVNSVTIQDLDGNRIQPNTVDCTQKSTILSNL